MAGSYIPATDAGFDAWSDNFATLLTADPTAYGEDAPTAAAVQASVDAWAAAYALATDPSTRTSVTVADKDSERVTATAVIRPVALRINANPIVTNMQREALGLTVRKTIPTPVPPPATAPTVAMRSAIPLNVTLSIRDESTPTSKAKPFGVIGAEVFVSVGEVAAVDPAQLTYRGTHTKTPSKIVFGASDQGKIATVATRWVTRSGPSGIAQVGPWSNLLVFHVL